MFTCPSCGSEVKQGQKFCGECGSKIDLSIYLKTAVSICQGQQSEGTQCGTELTTAVKFCPECSPPVPKDINEQADNVDPDGSGQGQVDNASLQGSIKITEEAVSKLNTYDAQTTLNSSQPNPENMAGGLASADISHPNPASMPGGQASTANNKPHPASMPGGQASTANNKPNPASMPGGQASTNSSQPNLASMPGGQVTTDSSQPNLASMPGGQVTTNSSQPNPASMPGGQVTTDSSQPNPASMPGGQVTTESSQPNPASMPEGQVTIDSSQPNPASMPGGQVTTDSSQPNPASMPVGQASTDSSQPNPASMPGGQVTTDSSQPNPASMPGGQVTTDSSQPNPASMPGGQASANSSQPNPAKMEGGQESANSSQPNPRNMPEGQASTDNNTATPNQQNEAKLMEKTIPNQSLTGNQSMSESSETFQSANISTHVNVNEQQQPVFGGAIKERIKEGNQEEAKSELPLKRFQDSFIFKGSKTVETGEIKINKSMVEKQATGNDGHQEDNKGQVQRSDAQQNMQLTETSDNPNNDTSGLTNDDQKNGKQGQQNDDQNNGTPKQEKDDQKNGTTMQQTLNQNNGTPTQQNDAEKQQLVITKKVETDGQGHGADGQQILKLDEKQDNLENLNKGNDAIGNEGGNTKTPSDDESSDSSESGNSEEDSKNVTTGRKRKNKPKNKKIKESKKKERKEESKKRKQQTKGEFQQQNSDMANAACSKATGTVDTIGDTHTNLTGNQGQPTPNKIFAEVTAPSASKIPKPENKNPLARSHIDVCFHVIVAPTILANPEKDVVVVAFEKLTDGWDSKKYKLKLERPRSDGYVKGTVTVPIPKYLVLAPLNYIYRVYHGDSKDSSTYEYFHVSGHLTDTGYSRLLCLPTDCFNKGIDEYMKQLKEDAEVAILAFQPAWQLKCFSGEGVNGEEMISKVAEIDSGLRKLYVQTTYLMDGQIFNSVFSKILVHHLNQQMVEIEKLDTRQLDAEARSLCLLAAVTITHFVVEYQINLQPMEKRLLCELLLPRPDFESKMSQDVDNLDNLLPKKKGKITESVLRFTRDIARLTIDPSWMCCVPIIHFMGKYSKPFEDGPTKINHDDDNPVWWGISKYADDVDYFKAKTEWDRHPDDIVKKLVPYFEVDYLLPRTMLASLKLEVLHAVVTTHNIPTDISLASTIFYLKKLYGVDKGLVRKLIVHVSKQCYSDKLDVSIAGLVNAYRTYRIAADLLTQSLKLPITNKAFHLPATETFLTSLDTFDKIQEKLEPKRNEYTNLNMVKDGHLTIFDKLRNMLVDWLVKEPFKGHELKFLELWNEALKVKIPSGRIKDVYIKHLADSLRTILQKMGSEEELIEIYCDHSDSFVGVVQEILSKVALNAVGKCKNFKFRKIKDERCNMRLGELLSCVFEMSWDVKNLENYQQALNHAVTWGPFPTYMELYCKTPDALSGYCQELLKKFVDIIQDYIQQLLQGNIVIRDLINLSNKHDNFQKVLIAMKIENAENIMMTIKVRIKEFDAFKTAVQIIQQFVYYSKQCKADTSIMETKLKVFSNPAMVPLSQLVKTVILEDLKNDIEHYRPIVTVFELSSEDLAILPKIPAYCKGFLFLKIWEKKGIELERKNGKLLPLNEVFLKFGNHHLNYGRICVSN